MQSKLQNLETILNYEVNLRKRKRNDISIRQPKMFKTIDDVIKELEVEDVVEHIKDVCNDLFEGEIKRYLKVIETEKQTLSVKE